MTKEYLISALKLDVETADKIVESIGKERFFRRLLYDLGLNPHVVEVLTRDIDPGKIITEDKERLINEAREKYGNFIKIKKKGKGKNDEFGRALFSSKNISRRTKEDCRKI